MCIPKDYVPEYTDKDRIKELEAHALKMEDLADKNLKNSLVLQDKLKEAEDILRLCKEQLEIYGIYPSILYKIENYFKDEAIRQTF